MSQNINTNPIQPPPIVLMQTVSPSNCLSNAATPQHSNAQTLSRSDVPTWTPRRRPGPPSKISKLRPELLSLVNELLDQGKSYEAVIEELARHGVKLNYDNVSKWYNGPY